MERLTVSKAFRKAMKTESVSNPWSFSSRIESVKDIAADHRGGGTPLYGLYRYVRLQRPGGYTSKKKKKWVGVCGLLPKTLTLFMTSLQANLRPKSAIFPTRFMTY